MRTFVVERQIPGAHQLTESELRGIAAASNEAIAQLDRPYTWLHSYVAGDRFYCVHRAESPETVCEHARLGGFPVDRVTEVAAVIDGSWAAT
jgi:hypothetical protein